MLSRGREGSSTSAAVAEKVRSILASKRLTLYRASQQSVALYGLSSPHFLPHHLYYDLRSGSFRPSIHQILTLSRISGYRLADWLRVFGFDLEDITRLQILLPSKRTIVLDTSLSDPNEWTPWLRNRPLGEPIPSITPLARLLELGPRRRIATVIQLDRRFIYAKVGVEDAFAFPELTPGSIVRPPAALAISTTPQHSAQRVAELVAALEVPFDPAQIEWRVTNTTQNQRPARGQVIPYADQRAYTDRLNALLTPAGWTRRYTVHTSANFERSKDKRIVAKVLVTCELTIFGLGSHSATGEEWADNDNAGTAAEAQAFKRACSCFGLGRYLYHFTGVWVDLDERKRPKNIPRLFGWATPQGWREGLRPGQEAKSSSSNPKPTPDVRDVNSEDASALVRQILEMAEPLGWRLYRGLLRTGARVWNPTQIRDANVLRKVLAQMQSAERGLRRLEAASNRVGSQALVPILRSLRLNSLAQVDNLETLKRVVHEVERAAENIH